MTDSELAALLVPIQNDANKYTRGSLLLLAGSVRFPGAAILAAKAAAKAGAGYVTLAIPQPAAQVAQNHLLSIPVIAASSQNGAFAADAWESVRAQVNHIDAVVLGPGLTITPSTSAFVQSVISGFEGSLVIDADALSILATLYADNKGLSMSSRNPILTPHAGELKRLLDKTQISDIEILAKILVSIIVAKGPTTKIVSPTQSYDSSTGTAALATAGTGDVLSGIIGSLLAQGTTAYNAALLGVEIHSLAGRIAEQKIGRRSVCAEDVIEAIPVVLQKLDALCAP